MGTRPPIAQITFTVGYIIHNDRSCGLPANITHDTGKSISVSLMSNMACNLTALIFMQITIGRHPTTFHPTTAHTAANAPLSSILPAQIVGKHQKKESSTHEFDPALRENKNRASGLSRALALTHFKSTEETL